MKTLVTLALTLILFSTAFANDGRYVEAMKKNIQSLYQAATIADLQNSVNALQRIASAEKTKWEPYYYITLGYIFMSTRENDAAKKDSFLDLAKEALAKASAIKTEDSEIIALEGFISMIRLTVDPATRGSQFAGLAASSFQKAIALNPQNPRAFSLLSQIQFGTAQFFNQPPTEACESARKSLTLFETDHSENPLAPVWGKAITEDLVKKCN